MRSTGKSRQTLLNKFKKQLAEKGELESFDVADYEVPTDIKALYLQLNEELFDGVLPVDLPVLWSSTLSKGRRKTKCWGKAYYSYSGNITKPGYRSECKPVKIEIALGLTGRHTRKVLVHEMCHIFCFQEFGEVGHGKQFWIKMRKCKYPKGHIFPNQQPGESDIWEL